MNQNPIVFLLRVLLVYLAWRAILALGGFHGQLFGEAFDPWLLLLEFALLTLLLQLSEWAAARLQARDSSAAAPRSRKKDSSWTQVLVRGDLDRKLGKRGSETESSDPDRK